MKKYRHLRLFCLLMIAASSCQPKQAPVDGAPGIGDPYYPDLGNGGYDVQNYLIVMEIDPPANTINASTTITATALEDLDSFNLDFQGLTLDSVNVDETEAASSRVDNELTIHPPRALEANQPFTVIVKYHGSPELIATRAAPFDIGWAHAESGSINVWGEPDAASTWFPSNDHPRDKATYRFEITVPDPWVVAATGTLKETKANQGKTTFIWQMDEPMATYLASINIDHYKVFTQSGPNGIKIRDYFPEGFPMTRQGRFTILPEAIDFLDDLFGPYPFPEYGVVIAHPEGFCEGSDTALEAQTLSIHCPSDFMSSPIVIVHELAHQWFGDSVSLENWKDVWLKEGFATYSEWLWDSKNDPKALSRIAKRQMENFADDPDFTVAEPPKENIYGGESYTGGALVLHALRLQVGDETFFTIVRTYAQRYRFGNAGSDEFIAVAEEVSGQSLKPFFDTWLFSKDMPDAIE